MLLMNDEKKKNEHGKKNGVIKGFSDLYFLWTHESLYDDDDESKQKIRKQKCGE